MARSTARKRALNTLYEADEKGQDILALLDERIKVPGAQTPLPEYAIDIVRGVAEHLHDIDAELDERSTGWKVARMGVVDRNILRIAVWEIMYNADVPGKVAIDEALGLATTSPRRSSTDCCPLCAWLRTSGRNKSGRLPYSREALCKRLAHDRAGADCACPAGSVCRAIVARLR